MNNIDLTSGITNESRIYLGIGRERVIVFMPCLTLFHLILYKKENAK